METISKQINKDYLKEWKIKLRGLLKLVAREDLFGELTSELRP